jgi:hypothetical protein
MPPVIDDNQASSDTKPPARRQYYAVRKCDSLRAPAIFLHWDDCSFYVEHTILSLVANEESKDEAQAEYQSFDQIAEAMEYISSSDSMAGQDDGDVDSSKSLEKTKKPDSTSMEAAVNSTTARTSSVRTLKRSAEEASLPSTGAQKKSASTIGRTYNALFDESSDNPFNLHSEYKENGGVVVLSPGRSLSKTELEDAIEDSSGWPDKHEKQSPFLEILRLAEKNACEKGWMSKLLFGAINEQLKGYLTEREQQSAWQHMEILKRITPKFVATLVELRSLVGSAWNLSVKSIEAYKKKYPELSIDHVVALSPGRSLSKTELEDAIQHSSGWPDEREKQSPFLEILRLAQKNACEKGWMRKMLFGATNEQLKGYLTEREQQSARQQMEILKRITPRRVASVGELRSLVGSAWNVCAKRIDAYERKYPAKSVLPKLSIDHVVALSPGRSLSKTELEDAIESSSGWPDKHEKQSPFLEILRLAEKNACEKGWMRKVLFGATIEQLKGYLTELEQQSARQQMEILKRITPRRVASLAELRGLVGSAWNVSVTRIDAYKRKFPAKSVLPKLSIDHVVALSPGRSLSKTELEDAIESSSGWPDKHEKPSPFLEILRLAKNNACEKGWMRKVLFGAINAQRRGRMTELEQQSPRQQIEILKRITPKLVASLGELRGLVGSAWNLSAGSIQVYERKYPAKSVLPKRIIDHVVVAFSSGRSPNKTELEDAIRHSSGWPDKHEKQSPFLEMLRLAEKNACEKGWMRKVLFGAINEQLRGNLTELEQQPARQQIEMLKRITPRRVASLGELRSIVGSAWNLSARSIEAYERKYPAKLVLPKLSIDHVVAL